MFATTIFVLLYTPISILAMSSLYMAWTSDPGAVPMGARPLVTVRRASSSSGELEASSTSASSSTQTSRHRRGMRRCHKCADNFKAPRAHHDSITGRCIVKFDHFCPWVGNAVGAMNHKFFVLFIAYTLCTCLLSIFLLILRAIHCGYVHDDDDSDEDNNNGNNRYLRSLTTTTAAATATIYEHSECFHWHESYSVLLLMIVSFVFLIFTCTMLFDQIEAIETNTSKIARMKMSVGQAGTELSRVTEEFNEMFGGSHKDIAWHWFLPMPVEFPRGMEKVVLGYEWDATFDPVPYDDGSGDSNGMNGTTAAAATTITTAATVTSPTNGHGAHPPPTQTAAATNIEMTVTTNSPKLNKSNGGDLTNNSQQQNTTTTAVPPIMKRQALVKRSNSRNSNNEDDMRLT